MVCVIVRLAPARGEAPSAVRDDALRLAPPLVLTKEHVDVALEIFDEAITASI